ncbi:DUF1642 domain-containing protein [Enterococcus ureilyticus]|uniref:DUF1642 domain-containing protein n=1 Tax=Enterococcus ureilyticus TaxID=1131292 RepID=UPI001A932791|nr:DUF1642 domain-containing protein [Enterococcus ureilyticus]MBO0445579.1 DUF1642 domain-containing protein [Enterococcus ureilyticus]
MGIEELINEKINDWDDCLNRHYGGETQNSDVLIRAALSDMEQLKSSLPTQKDKVVVPELIHKWIKHVKGLKWGLADLLNPSVSNSYLARDAKEWLEKDKIHAEILARAWLEDDYTMEKEPLYWIYDSIADQYLGYDRAEEKVWWLLKQNDGARAELTDAEITKVGEQYRAFAVPVEEDE